jgi:hypothetical protein
MHIRRGAVLMVGVLLVSRAAGAQVEDKCDKGNCEYRFDDEDVNSPGWSAYADVIKIHPIAPRVTLIRPRISFVMELIKTTEGM